MLIGIGDVFAQIPQRRAAERVMLAAQAAARRQEGCLSYSFAEVLGDPGHYLVVQSWRDQESLDAHHRSASFADYQSAITPLLSRDSELELHTVERSVRPEAEEAALTLDTDG